MPNAKDAKSGAKLFMLWGQTGTGKTTQFLTLPGRKFAYLFDPAALESLRGADIEYAEFIGDEVNLNPTSMGKAESKGIKTTPVVPVEKPTKYDEWLKDFTERLASNYFDDFDTILFDSLTTFGTLVMNRQIWINDRRGNVAHQDDYLPQMGTVHGAMQKLIGKMRSAGKTVLVTGHEQVKENAMGIAQVTLLVTGSLREQIPLLFSDVYQCVADDGKFFIKTMKTIRMPAIRSSFREITSKRLGQVDVTIENWNHPEQYGLGALMAGDLPLNLPADKVENPGGITPVKTA